MSSAPNPVINNLNEAIKYYDSGDWHRAAGMITEAYTEVGGMYRSLLDSLSGVLYNMEGALEDLNMYSRELFGEDCARNNTREEVLKCLVKVRDWFQERLRVDGACIYDNKAPREFIDACKLTSEKLRRINEGGDVYVFADPNEVEAYWNAGSIGSVRRMDEKLVLMAKPYMDAEDIEKLGRELGISLSDCTQSFVEEVMCEVKNENDVAKALTYTVILDHTSSNTDLLTKYAEKLELNRFKELMSGDDRE